MASFLKNLVIFGAGCAIGGMYIYTTHCKEAFTVGGLTVYYPYRSNN